MRQLRPHLALENYFSRIYTLMKEKQYRLFAAYNAKNKCIGVVSFQQQNRLSLGHIIYLADLVTDETYRSSDIDSRLLAAVNHEAVIHKIDTIVLDSGVQRKKAHEFYQRYGYQPESYSFRLHKPFTINIVEK